MDKVQLKAPFTGRSYSLTVLRPVRYYNLHRQSVNAPVTQINEKDQGVDPQLAAAI